jgi:hypothetical protein
MKKLLFLLLFVFCLNFNSFSQNNFFNKSDKTEQSSDSKFPGLPGHGESGDQPAPIESGILILSSLGAAYALSKKNKN